MSNPNLEPAKGVLRLLNDLSDQKDLTPEMKIRIWEARHDLIRFADCLPPGNVHVQYIKILIGASNIEELK